MTMKSKSSKCIENGVKEMKKGKSPRFGTTGSGKTKREKHKKKTTGSRTGEEIARHSHHGPANQSAAFAEISSQDAIFLCVLRYIISNPSPFVTQCTCGPTILCPRNHKLTKRNWPI